MGGRPGGLNGGGEVLFLNTLEKRRGPRYSSVKSRITKTGWGVPELKEKKERGGEENEAHSEEN